MSTKISTIHASIISKLSSIYPTKNRIPNAYSIVDNPEQLLKNSYGLKYNGSERQSYEICSRRERASFSLVLTVEFFKLDTGLTSFDDPTTTILEDAETFKFEFSKTNMLNNTDIININTTSTSGLANIQGDKYNFLSIEVNFEIDYFEDR